MCLSVPSSSSAEQQQQCAGGSALHARAMRRQFAARMQRARVRRRVEYGLVRFAVSCAAASRVSLFD